MHVCSEVNSDVSKGPYSQVTVGIQLKVRTREKAQLHTVDLLLNICIGLWSTNTTQNMESYPREIHAHAHIHTHTLHEIMFRTPIFRNCCAHHICSYPTTCSTEHLYLSEITMPCIPCSNYRVQKPFGLQYAEKGEAAFLTRGSCFYN